MHRVMIDTNVLIDLVSSSRHAHGRTATAIGALLGSGDFEGCVLSSALKNVYYVYCRHYGDEPSARRAVRELRRMFALVNLTPSVVDAALDSDEPDFEDGLVRAAAEGCGCEYLLTRDAPGFLSASFEKLDADALLATIAGSQDGPRHA